MHNTNTPQRWGVFYSKYCSMNQTKEYITEEEINKAKHELAYGCFYMKKLYEDIERIQN